MIHTSQSDYTSDELQLGMKSALKYSNTTFTDRTMNNYPVIFRNFHGNKILQQYFDKIDIEHVHNFLMHYTT